MEQVFEFTKDQLIEAFRLYNKEALDQPEDFDTLDYSEDEATRQAEKLLSLLAGLQK